MAHLISEKLKKIKIDMSVSKYLSKLGLYLVQV